MKQESKEMKKLLNKQASARTLEELEAVIEEMNALRESEKAPIKTGPSKEPTKMTDFGSRDVPVSHYAPFEEISDEDKEGLKDSLKKSKQLSNEQRVARDRKHAVNRGKANTIGEAHRRKVATRISDATMSEVKRIAEILKSPRWVPEGAPLEVIEEVNELIESVSDSIPMSMLNTITSQAGLAISDLHDKGLEWGKNVKQDVREWWDSDDDDEAKEKPVPNKTTAIGLEGGTGRSPETGDFMSAKAARNKYAKDTEELGYEQWETPEELKMLQKQFGTTEEEDPRFSFSEEEVMEGADVMTDDEASTSSWDDLLKYLGMSSDEEDEDEEEEEDEDFIGSLDPESDYGLGASKLDFNSGKGMLNPTKRYM